MQLTYTTGWAINKVKTEQDYLDWLASLQDGDQVLFQSFNPASDSALDWPMELWFFELSKVWGNQIVNSDNNPIIREKGVATYWNSDDEWGKVFPARIVPVCSDFQSLKNLGDKTAAQRPIYEPRYYHNYRHVFHSSWRGYSYKRGYGALQKQFPVSYKQECDTGLIINVFDSTYPDELVVDIPDVSYLYSKYIAP